MACLNPLEAWIGKPRSDGKANIVWRRAESPEQERQVLPCGHCLDCRLKYSKMWAARCMDEARCWKDNVFVTLTYDNEHLPEDGNIQIRDVQLFLKRLRKARGPAVRFFFGAEYGGKLGRPHYHGLLFNCDFPDKVFKVERFGNKVYESAELRKLWPHGFHSIGDVNMKSAAYVARYCLKKVSGKEADEHYANKDTGVVRLPERVWMSRGSKKLGTGGIGSEWFKKYKDDVYPSDEVIVNGRVQKPPRYYDNLLDKSDPELLELIKERRREHINKRDNTPQRLRAKAEYLEAQVKKLNRPLGG